MADTRKLCELADPVPIEVEDEPKATPRAPRYDEVYAAGVALLDADARGAVDAGSLDEYEWPEDQQTHAERLYAISTWLVEQSDLPGDEARAFAAEIDKAAQRIEKMEAAL